MVVAPARKLFQAARSQRERVLGFPGAIGLRFFEEESWIALNDLEDQIERDGMDWAKDKL